MNEMLFKSFLGFPALSDLVESLTVNDKSWQFTIIDLSILTPKSESDCRLGWLRLGLFPLLTNLLGIKSFLLLECLVSDIESQFVCLENLVGTRDASRVTMLGLCL